MKLKFYAGAHVREAGIHPSIGQASRYYGRTFDPMLPEGQQYPANREPFEVTAGTEDGEKCAKQCRKGVLFAADATTAAALGVPLVEVELVGGNYAPKAAKKPAPAALSTEKAAG